MFVYLERIAADLRRRWPVECHRVGQQVITGFARFPAEPDAQPPEAGETAYIMEYRQLLRYEMTAPMPPIVCVVPAGVEASPVFFSGRTVIAVLGASEADVLLALTDSAYESGLRSSRILEASHAFLQCGSMQQLLRAGARALGNPVIVTDSRQEIIASAAPAGVDSAVYREILALRHINAGHPGLTPEDGQPGALIWQSEHGELPAICCRALVPGGAQGYVHVLQFGRALDGDDRYLIELLGDLLAAMLLRRPSAPHTQEGRVEQFFINALDGRFGSAEKLYEAQRAIAIRTSEFMYAVVIRARRAELVARTSYYGLAKQLSQRLPYGFGFLYRDSIFLMMGLDAPSADLTAELQPIVPLLRENHLAAGVSNGFSRLHLLREHAHQAVTALSLGCALHPERDVYPFADYAVYYMVGRSLRGERAETFLAPEFAGLLAYCREHGDDLLDTLRVYLRCGCNKSQTAKELFVHLNTVKYRVEKIEQLLGYRLDQGDRALRLMLSLRVLEYSEHFPEGMEEAPPAAAQ